MLQLHHTPKILNSLIKYYFKNQKKIIKLSLIILLNLKSLRGLLKGPKEDPTEEVGLERFGYTYLNRQLNTLNALF